MKKLTLAFFLVALSVALVFAGGGKSGASSATNSNTIVLWTFADTHARYYEWAAAEYKKTHPDFNMTVESMTGGAENDRLAVITMSGGEGSPDLVDIEQGTFPRYMTDEKMCFEPLTKWMERDGIAQKMVMAREALYQYKGNYYGIEVALCPVTMAYRKDLFDKYNIKVPTTWAEFLDAARKFKPYGIGIAATPDMRAGLGDDINILLRAANSDIVDPNGRLRITPAYKQLVADYKMMQQQELSYMFQTDEERWTGIRENKVATYFMADWAAGWLRDNVPEQANMWSMASLPKYDAQSSPTSANGGTGLHMMKYTKKDKEMLWDMIKYLHIDPDMNVEKFRQVSLFPPVYDAMDRCSGPVAYYNNQDLGALYKSLSTQMPTQYQAGWRSVYSDAINANMYDYYEGNITVDQLIKFGEDAVKNY